MSSSQPQTNNLDMCVYNRYIGSIVAKSAAEIKFY